MLIQAIGICKSPRLRLVAFEKVAPPFGFRQVGLGHQCFSIYDDDETTTVGSTIYIIFIYICIAKLTYHLIMSWVQGNEMTTSSGGHHKLLSLGMMFFLL